MDCFTVTLLDCFTFYLNIFLLICVTGFGHAALELDWTTAVPIILWCDTSGLLHHLGEWLSVLLPSIGWVVLEQEMNVSITQSGQLGCPSTLVHTTRYTTHKHTHTITHTHTPSLFAPRTSLPPKTFRRWNLPLVFLGPSAQLCS